MIKRVRWPWKEEENEKEAKEKEKKNKLMAQKSDFEQKKRKMR